MPTHVEDSGKPSRRVVEQRIRNRVIEYLEFASSFEDQQAVDGTVPSLNTAYEVIHVWEDYVDADPRHDQGVSVVYDSAEVEAIGQVHAAWEQAAAVLPREYPSLSDVQALPEWRRLRDVAASALTVFMRRGKMSEDREVEN
jgi:hypothetical protein